MSQCIVQFALRLIQDTGLSPSGDIITNTENAIAAFDKYAPESSQSAILSGAYDCVASEIEQRTDSLASDLVTSVIIILLTTIIVSVVCAVVIAYDRTRWEALYIAILLVLLASTYLFIYSLPSEDIEGCLGTAAESEKIYKFQSSQAINAALCSY